MDTPSAAVVLALGSLSWTACKIVDDDQPIVTGTDGIGEPSEADQQVCLEAANDLLAMGCPYGTEPRVYYDGGNSTIVLADDPGARVGLGLGLVVQFGGEAGADWVGYGLEQNSQCTYGCFGPSCQPGQVGCYSLAPSGGLCGLHCSNEEIGQEACNSSHVACRGTDPDAGGTAGDDGLDESGDGGDDSDETGGETTGGVLGEPYDCGQWHPEAIQRPVPGGAFHVPQAIVDDLVLGDADPLAECDGVRLRQGRGGRWVISRMHSAGLLGALGLRVGDELQAFDGVELDSLDALVGLLGSFVEEDGNPRQFDAEHPGFSLRVHRDRRSFSVGLRVVPSTIGVAGGR